MLGEVIGVGGFGQVHRATDTVTGEEVAVKLIRALSPADLARARRELAALRWLRLPGVVRLRDDGFDGPFWFLVMDLVQGQRFGEEAHGWTSLRPLALELLEVLARVHLAGVLHLDLKPSNVLVDDGRIVVLDFGISRGRMLPEVAPGTIEGTPRYMAPEQARGEPCDERTDLYAVAAMVLGLDPELPSDVRAVFEAMRAEAPGDRPASALDAYERLAGRKPFPEILDRVPPWTRPELTALFAGADRFTHLPSDASELLWAQTGGEPSAVREVLGTWFLSGRATWDGDRVVIDRLGLEQIRGEVPIDLRGDPVEDEGAVVARARIAAGALRQQGRLGPATALLEAVLPLLGSLDGEDAEALLTERVLCALAAETRTEMELALCALERVAPTLAIHRMGGLVRAARAVLVREPAEIPSAPFEDPELEMRRQGWRAKAASRAGAEAEAAVLSELDAWADDDAERRAMVAGWWGNHLYRIGRFGEAAAAHERAASGKRTLAGRASSLLGAAKAWLEALDLPRAEARAAEVAELAYQLRHPLFEADAVWVARTAAYRAGRPAEPEEALVAAAEAVAPLRGALFAATDAATAWRARDAQRCATLAERAAKSFLAAGMPAGVLLMRALAAYVRGDDLTALIPGLDACTVPDIALQVLAFARWRHPDALQTRFAERAAALASQRPREQWSARLDVMSIDECLADTPPTG